ncbi:putative lipid carrier protein YhbT [Thioalbus denitrificans]|uniref:Ubiquinone biosynthesis accessory factor UbiT n=2 Tax=Thioalbus denitrificans TaxID=547122 RepID=A0A369CG93_9GAMM|nr:putative lipid carrier protein YhbT [Thioalbus denitrificans]
MDMQTRKPPPRLSRLLTFPVGLVPTATHSTTVCLALNRIFATALRDGELEFLEGRVVRIRVNDLRLRLCFTLERGRLRPADERRPHDLTIEGDTYDFLLLASRREDPDTLFFNRRLRLGGDTELGLYVKNFLDAYEPPERLQPLMGTLERASRLFERFA